MTTKERNLFNELKAGLEDYQGFLEGKITLRTETAEMPHRAPVEISPDEIRTIRQRLNLSQAVFAKRLRTSIRTYQQWEQGRTKPNPQAALLLRIVERAPQAFELIANV